MFKGNVLFIGGDLRQIYTARLLAENGYEISFFGWETYEDLDDTFNLYHNLKIALILADYIVLPTPILRSGKFNAPFSENPIEYDEIVHTITSKQVVFGGGFLRESIDFFAKEKIRIFDFLKDEEIVLKNSYFTAEATVGEILNVFASSLHSKRVLLIGYGRISKFLARLLSAFKANVTIAARKKGDLTLAKLSGIKSEYIASVHDLNRYDLVINTVPVKLFHTAMIRECKVPYFDLAYFEKTENTNYYVLPGLPGKWFPATCGEMHAHYILEKISEVENE